MPTERITFPGHDGNQLAVQHYMSGEPGNDVEGGWEFQSPEGDTYALKYK